MIDRQMINVKTLVSHTYRFEDSEQAFATVRNYTDSEGNKAMKVVILHGTDSHHQNRVSVA